MMNRLRRVLVMGAILMCLVVEPRATSQPFTLQGPGVDTNDFRVTTFASGLDFPLGMAELEDGSLLVTISEGSSFWSSSGKLVRFTDANEDGIADDSGTVLYSGLPGSLTDLEVLDSLVTVIGRPFPITVLRAGASPSDPLTRLGEIIINYTGSRQHGVSALALRRSPGSSNRYDLLFQLGSENDSEVTTNALNITNSDIPGAEGVLPGDDIHMLTLIDSGSAVTATNLTRIVYGARNAAGIDFHPVTGDLYFQDNGIDGSIAEKSADELNWIARTNIGGAMEFFGFPSNYTAYRTGTVVGGAGIQPLITFQPIPDPFTGLESEGPNDIEFAPPGFPDGLNTGVFIGFHGKYSSGGVNNEENPLVYADPATGDYFHFILGQQPGIGHLDGLLATRNSLFVADLSSTGSLSSGGGAGVIYQIKSLVSPPPTLEIKQLELTWDRGTLQESVDVHGEWTDVPEAFSPHFITPVEPRKFYRVRY